MPSALSFLAPKSGGLLRTGSILSEVLDEWRKRVQRLSRLGNHVLYGNPCKHGHSATRQTCNSACAICSRIIRF